MTVTVPALMRAAVLREAGQPMRVETIPTPSPRRGEALVRVSACGMCHSDLHVLGGAIAFPLPAVVGHEIAGVVVALGADTERSGLAVGDHVSGGFLMPCGQCGACGRGRDDLCDPFFSLNRLRGVLYDGETRLAEPNGSPIAMYSMGGLAEYCVVPVTALAKTPEVIDMTSGSVLGCAALTAYGAVRRGADLRFGESVAVIAVGGVGSTIVTLARAFGASHVIAIDVDDDKLAAAEALGATHTINSRGVEDLHAEVAQITGRGGVEVAFEALGQPATWRSALDVLADGGRMVPIGLGAGVQTAEVEINRLVRRSQSILGSYGARTRTDLPEVVRLAASGVIRYRDVVTRRFRLDDVNEGYEALRAGRIVGRGVIDMSL